MKHIAWLCASLHQRGTSVAQCMYICITAKFSADSLSPPLLRLCPAILCPDYRAGPSVKQRRLQCPHCQPLGAPLPDAIMLSLACSSRQGKPCWANASKPLSVLASLVIFKMHLPPLLPLIQKVPPTPSKSPSLSFPFLCVILFALNWRSLGVRKTLRACLYHRYLWKAHGAILPDYSYLLNWVKCNVIPKTAFRMKEKACKAREIIAAIWGTENAKQRSTILFCVRVDHVRLFVWVWVFPCLMYPNKRILHGVHDEQDTRPPISLSCNKTISVEGSGTFVVGMSLQQGRLSVSPSM